MSYDNANDLMDLYDKWDSREQRRTFLSKMERKLKRKEQRYSH